MWEKVKLGDVCEVTNGYAFKSSQYVNLDGARVIRITNVQKGKIIDNDPKLYPFNLLNGLSNFEIFENDILMSLTGNVGRVGLFPKEMLPAYLNQRVCKIEPISNKILKQYLFHYLNSDGFEKEAMNASGGAAQLNLSSNWVNSYVIPLPPLPIQEKIADILDKADELRRKDKDLQTKYDELAQAIFIDMFGDPVRNEKGWEVKKLEEVVGFKTGPFGSLLHKEDYIENGVPVINPTHIIDSKIQPDYNFSVTDEKFSELKAYTVKHNDILIGRRGEMGRCGIVNESMLPMLCGTGCFIINNSEKEIKSKYLHRVMTSISVKEYLEHEAIGVTMKNLNTKILKKLTIGIPPIHLQEAFAKKIELINQLKAQTNTEKSEELFQSLLQKAFKGELVR